MAVGDVRQSDSGNIKWNTRQAVGEVYRDVAVARGGRMEPIEDVRRKHIVNNLLVSGREQEEKAVDQDG
jgi:hypothetical protein